jgi:hypothetical protein
MRQLTLTLSEEAYQRLFSEAEEKKQSVEDLAIECITTGSSYIVESAKRIQAKAKRFLQKHAGKILRIGNPELDLDDIPFWRVPIFLSTDSLSKAPLGVISISVSSGEILTTDEEIDKMLQLGLEILGFRRIPKEKQSRLSELMRLKKYHKISAEEDVELEQLLAFADAQELKGLLSVKEKLENNGDKC